MGIVYGLSKAAPFDGPSTIPSLLHVLLAFASRFAERQASLIQGMDDAHSTSPAA